MISIRETLETRLADIDLELEKHEREIDRLEHEEIDIKKRLELMDKAQGAPR